MIAIGVVGVLILLLAWWWVYRNRVSNSFPVHPHQHQPTVTIGMDSDKWLEMMLEERREEARLEERRERKS